MTIKARLVIGLMVVGAAVAACPPVIAQSTKVQPAASGASLGDVQRHLREVTSMTASFSQSDQRGHMASGQLMMKRPGRVRFEYGGNSPLLIVGDGKALTMIDYSVKQVSRWPIGNSPLSVLLNPDKDMARFARIIPSADPRVVTMAAHDPKHPEFGEINIIFVKQDSAPAGLMLVGWTVVDAQNNRSTVRLSNQRFNVPVSDSIFAFRDPRPRTKM